MVLAKSVYSTSHVKKIHNMVNWSKIKRRIMIGSLSGRNFIMRTVEMDNLRNNSRNYLF